jgi:hypothetical protein
LKVIADEEAKLSSYLSICSFFSSKIDKQGFYHDWQEALREEAISSGRGWDLAFLLFFSSLM